VSSGSNRSLCSANPELLGSARRFFLLVTRHSSLVTRSQFGCGHKPRRVLLSLIVAAAALVAFEPRAQAAGQDSEKKDKEFVIKTPSVALEASQTPDLAHLGLPVYPGAKYVKDESRGSLDFNLSVSGKPNIHFVVLKFQTPDSKEKVRDFYQKKLGKAVTKFTEKDEDGNMAFEIKHPKDQRYVGLKSVDGNTEIDLVRVQGVDDNDK